MKLSGVHVITLRITSEEAMQLVDFAEDLASKLEAMGMKVVRLGKLSLAASSSSTMVVTKTGEFEAVHLGFRLSVPRIHMVITISSSEPQEALQIIELISVLAKNRGLSIEIG